MSLIPVRIAVLLMAVILATILVLVAYDPDVQSSHGTGETGLPTHAFAYVIIGVILMKIIWDLRKKPDSPVADAPGRSVEDNPKNNFKLLSLRYFFSGTILFIASVAMIFGGENGAANSGDSVPLPWFLTSWGALVLGIACINAGVYYWKNS